MTRLYLNIPGLEYETELAHETDIVPSVGDRIYVRAEYLDKYSRRVLEQTPAYHCFERNKKTERMSMAEYLKDSVVTVTGRGWGFENGMSCCTLEVEVEY